MPYLATNSYQLTTNINIPNKDHVLWAICGAAKGVGKTTYALNLLDLLPDSIYAKHGHGQRKSHKEANFFQTIEQLREFIDENLPKYRHVIIESNDFAKLKIADITIFIDREGKEYSDRRDRDQLEASADYIVNSFEKRHFSSELIIN